MEDKIRSPFPTQNSHLLPRSELLLEGNPNKRPSTLNLVSNGCGNFEKVATIIKSGNWDQVEDILRKCDKQLVSASDERGMTLLHIACEYSRHECVRVLLESGADPNQTDGILRRSPLHWALDTECHCDNCSTKIVKCLEKLLAYGANVDCDDVFEDTPLRLAAKNILPKCAMVLIDHGAHIKEKNHHSSGHMLIRRMPGVFIRILDKGIAYDEKDKTRLKLDFGFLFIKNKEVNSIPGRKSLAKFDEMFIVRKLTKITSADRKAIFTHPWLEAFLHLKWMAVRKWFWIIRMIYGCFVTFYTYFIFDIYVWECPYSLERYNSSSSTIAVNNTLQESCDLNFPIPLYISAGVGSLCIFFMILNEIFEFKVDRGAYVKNYLNLLWWILIFIMILTLPPAFGLSPRSWQYPVASFGIFYAWAMNFTQVSRLPFFGDYVEMLGKVLGDFTMFLTTFMSLIIAFGLSMCVMFPKNEFFGSVPLAFVKILTIMIGEADYEGLFKENERVEDLEYSIPAHLIYVAFIFTVTIVLMNLLLALAVSDIQELRRQSSIKRAIRQITQISILETFINNVGIGRWLAGYVLRRSSVEATYGRFFTFSPINPSDTNLPPELKQKFMPYLTRSHCLNKNKRNKLKSILAPIRWKNYKNSMLKKCETPVNLHPTEAQIQLQEMEHMKSMLKSLTSSVADMKFQLDKLALKLD